MKESRMREFNAQDPDLVALMGDNQQVNTLRNRLTELRPTGPSL